MSRKNEHYGDKKNKKCDCYKIENVTQIDGIDLNKILVSKEKPYGAKNKNI